jgi:hypothetical protein
MYYTYSNKNLGYNRGVLYLEHISVYVQYIINTYVIDVVVPDDGPLTRPKHVVVYYILLHIT